MSVTHAAMLVEYRQNVSPGKSWRDNGHKTLMPVITEGPRWTAATSHAGLVAQPSVGAVVHVVLPSLLFLGFSRRRT